MDTHKLSSYTIAKNCSDLSDINAGMKELNDYFDACLANGKKPSDTAYIRYSKLAAKRDKLKPALPNVFEQVLKPFMP